MDNKLNFDDCWYKDVCTNECTPHCIRFLEMDYLMSTSQIPKAKQRPIKLVPDDIDYDAFVRLAEIKSNITEFVDKGNNLYLASETTGNGKTSWAIKIMLKYFDSIWAGNGFRTRGLFIYVPTFLAKLKDFNNRDIEFEKVKTAISDVDLVIWDDIGTTNLSNYDLSQMCNYIDQRILEEKANIFTGNLIGDDLNRVVGSRLYSRIWHSSEKIILKGMDRR